MSPCTLDHRTLDPCTLDPCTLDHRTFLLTVLVSCSVLFSALAATLPGQQRPSLPADRSVGGDTINPVDLKTWLTRLSSPEFAGRGTGQPGFQKAADCIRTHFEKLGLKAGGDDGEYFQKVPWTKIATVKNSFKFDVHKGEKVLYSVGLDLVRGSLPRPLEASGKAMIAVVSDLDDPPFDEVELEDTVVFALITDTTKRTMRSRNSAMLSLQKQARRTGAGAVILVDDATYAASPELSGPSYPRTSRAAAGRYRRSFTSLFTSLVISKTAFGTLLAKVGKPLATVAVSEGTIPLGADVTIEAHTEKRQAPAYNVVGILEGSDPKLRDEYVVIGCHLDHLGKVGSTIYPGADDDGSGSAGLMAISRAFARNGKTPKRSVLFVAFCGEEKGLIGSGYFARNPPVKLEQIVAELQVDMIGRDEEGRREKAEDNKNSVHLIGSKKLSMDLHELCVRLNERAKFDLEYDEEGVFYRSDHWNFARYGVPIAFFFTGFHRDYHRPTDTVEKINFPKLARISRYVYDIGFELATAPHRPLVDEARWRRLRQKGRAEPAAPVRKEK